MKNLQSFDLHVHTNASDGSFSPSDLIKRASEEGITTLAITDHDTVSGIDESLKAGKKFGLNVISGVEISIDFNPGTMHICGYFIDIKNDNFRDGLNFVQKARRNRNPKIIEKLNQLGIDITLEEVIQEAGSDQIGRPHFAKALLKKGYVRDIKEAFTKYLAKGALCYVDKKRLKKEYAIKIIKGAGGIAVLAHPIQLQLESDRVYKLLFEELRDLGVAGIEAYSSHQSDEENTKFKNLTDELGMLVTGGSDFHGDIKPDIELGVFGEDVQIDLNQLMKKMQRRVF